MLEIACKRLFIEPRIQLHTNISLKLNKKSRNFSLPIIINLHSIKITMNALHTTTAAADAAATC